MNTSKKLNILFIAVSAATVGGLTIAQDFEIVRHTMTNGGTMQSSAGNLELSGNVGQPISGMMSNGAFEMTGGFWFEEPAGDCNADGSVSLMDYAGFVSCVTGPVDTVAETCRCFDLDRDGAVDLHDFGRLQITFIPQ